MKKNPLRIAYVNNHYQLGGAETVVRQLHEGIQARGLESSISVSEGHSWPRDKRISPLYPRVLARLDHTRLRFIVQRFFPKERWTDQAFRKLAASSADIIHVHSFHGVYATLESLAYLVKAKPVVWTFHRFWGITGGCDHPFECRKYLDGCGGCPQLGRFPLGLDDTTNKEWRRKMATLAEAPLTIIAPSLHLAEKVRQSPIGRQWNTVVINNGVEPRDFSGTRKQEPEFRRSLGLSENKTTAIFTNRDFKDPIKGFPTIVKALRGINPDKLQLILAGGSSAWARGQLPKELDVVDLGYVGDRERLADYYEASDLFLYASDGENFPCAVLEAMSCECCVVTTPVDGVTEQVVHNESGIVASDNNAQELKLALESVLDEPKKRRQIGARARATVMHQFTETGMIEAHLDLYHKMIKS